MERRQMSPQRGMTSINGLNSTPAPPHGYSLGPQAYGTPTQKKLSPRRETLGMLGSLKGRSQLITDAEKDVDENFKHKLAQSGTHLLPIQHVPDYSVKHAEERLRDADRRVRMLQAEAETLETLRKQQLMAAEEEVLRLKRKLLDDWEDRERDWEKRREEELRNIKMKEAMLDEQQQRLSELEDRQERMLQENEERLRQKDALQDAENRMFLQKLEERMRRELRQMIEPELRDEIERELTHRITGDVKEELQREFARMCETMRVEVQKARERVRSEVEREMEPIIEARLYQQVTTRIEQELHDTVLKQLKDANSATQMLKDELSAALDDRDRNMAEAATLRRELQNAQNTIQKLEKDLKNAENETFARDTQLAALQKEHALLQQAANSVLQQARASQKQPQPQPQPHLQHPPPSPQYAQLSPPRHPQRQTIMWPPQLLPGGGVAC
eukprot:TRINITY_DN42418_c0_g1_i1.p1 TRINITY_DN42418_c0_g1~~TRINITY_DN42418_c0_g1_i1.p1  ORF type:complete len:445 (+),score=168.30 TRINITY_DN42418_c0_g1_i1:89-1423(+)